MEKNRAREASGRMSRRSLLRASWQSLAAAGLGTMYSAPARAVSGALVDRALVCIYLYGGNDSNNMIVPMAQYDSYVAARGKLAIPASSLLTVNTATHGDFGFHPSLERLTNLFRSRYLAVVANIGPTPRPARHEDSGMSYFTYGYAAPAWAARMAGTTHASRNSLFTGFPSLLSGGDPASSVSMLAPGTAGGPKLQASLNSIARTPLSLKTEFPATGIGQQLRQVAALIHAGPQLGITRPIFTCAMAGFSTRGDQMARQDALFLNLAAAMTAFYEATIEMGVAHKVTTYTDSEFGRTLTPNESGGTDAGWGAHHLVLGNSVLGGDVYGRFPLLKPGGPDDATGRGVWAPANSKDQYAATLANWLGAPYGALTSLMPTLAGSTPTLGFMA